eukprot:CAMPEP_0116022662 /NCGR_PEP_ID=MMETSP0321-20121206/11116_1 /TAXON_ID=163516 /ORGANISM="Leptocylindrus danicus var. danicus, Strain B650" /LENGTH=521 /DNA_ID=CAMNT_0003493767 /DNA_START=803 /DNA_END=2368 /DNA_ORIENTATION=+
MDTQRQNPNNLASLKGAGLLRQEIPLDGSSNKKKSGKDDGPRILFPAKLHNLLTNANDDPNISCTIQWDIHGRSFKVARSKLFEKDVLPKYFKITKMKSFIRQLNLYNFTRITSGRDQGSYYHVDFLRGQYKQCTMIRREKRMAMPKKDYDPEFHTMPFVGTLADPRDEEQKEEQGIKATTAPVSQALSANRDVSYPNPNSGVENNPCLGVFDNTTRIVQSPNANAQVSQGYTNGGWYCPRNVGAQDEAMNQGINQYRTFNTAGDVHVPDMQSGVRQQTGAVPDENSKHQNWSSSPSSSNIQGHRPPFPNHTNMQYHPDLNKSSQGFNSLQVFAQDQGTQGPFPNNLQNLPVFSSGSKQAQRVSQYVASLSSNNPLQTMQQRDHANVSANDHSLSHCASKNSPFSSNYDSQNYWAFIGQNTCIRSGNQVDAHGPISQALIQNDIFKTDRVYDCHLEKGGIIDNHRYERYCSSPTVSDLSSSTLDGDDSHESIVLHQGLSLDALNNFLEDTGFISEDDLPTL